MYEVSFTDNAVEDMLEFPKGDRAMLVDTAVEQLSHEPTKITRNRKPLRPNDLSRWEVRAGDYRIFYDVDEQGQRVTVKAVGVKRHNALFIRGREYRL